MTAEHLLNSGNVEAGTAGLIEAAKLLESASRVDEAIAALTMAIDAMDACDRRIDVMEHAARIASDSEHARANDLWADVVALRASTGDRNGEARALYFQSWVAPSEQSIELLKRAQHLGAEDLGWSAKAASVFSFRNADYAGSAAHNLRALELAREALDTTLEASALHSLSLVQMMDGRMLEAISLLKQAIALAIMQGNHHSAVSSQLNLIQMLQADAMCEEAMVTAADLVRYVDEHGLRAWQMEAWSLRGAILSNCGQIEAAREAYVHCADLDRRFVNDSSAMYIAYYLGATAYELGYIDEALEHCSNAYEAAHSRDDRLGVLLVSALRSRCYIRTGEDAKAFETLTKHEFDDPMAAPEICAWMVLQGLRTGDRNWVDHALSVADKFRNVDFSMTTLAQLFLDITAAARLDDAGQVADAIMECADGLWNRSRRVDAIRCRIAVASMLAREGCKDRALQLATSAHRDLVNMGATLDIEHASSLISSLVDSGIVTRGGRARVSSLAPEQLKTLSPFLTSMRFDKGKTFFDQNDVLDAVYVVRSGRVRLSTLEDDGKLLTIAILEEGDVFGESALLGDAHARSHLAAEAMEDGMVGTISVAAMRKLISAEPALAMNLVSIVAERMQRAQRLAVQLAFSSVEQRLMHLIVELDERYGHPTLDGARIVNCTFTQSDLAEMIGARRDTVSQLLSELRKSGFIEMRKRRITILDLDWLARASLAGRP